MNPDSKTYTFRCLVSKKASVDSEPASLPSQDAESAITFEKAGNVFSYGRFWRKCHRRGASEAILEDFNREFGISIGIDTAIPAIFLNQLIENS
jgi:hypothetical protein